MRILYDKKSSITWPDGSTMTAEELKEHPRYRILFDYDHILETDGDGITFSYARLAYLKDSYGVTEADPEKALALIQQAQAEAEAQAQAEQITLEGVQAQNDEIMLALAELGALIGGE